MDEKRERDLAKEYQTVGGSPILGQQGREKTWDECGIEEKVERLRRVLRDLGMVAQRAERVAGMANERAIHHRHDLIGLPMMPLDTSKYAGPEAGVERDPWMTRGLE